MYLSQPLVNQELWVVAIVLAASKSLSSDNLAVQFYTRFWDLLGDELTEMLQLAHYNGWLPSHTAT